MCGCYAEKGFPGQLPVARDRVTAIGLPARLVRRSLRNAVCGDRRAEAALRAGRRRRAGTALRSWMVVRLAGVQAAVRVLRADAHGDGARPAGLRKERPPRARLPHPRL